MTHSSILQRALVASAVLLSACDADEAAVNALEQDCDEIRAAPADVSAAGINFTVASGLTASTSASDLTLRGSAEHKHGLAIRRIQIAGVDAVSERFNFGQWSAKINLDSLGTMPHTADGLVDLDVQITDTCGTYAGDPMKPLQVTLDVPDFTLMATYPKVPGGGDTAADYIPADNAVAAVLTISSDKAAAVGARIRVNAEPAEGVTLDGLAGGAVTLAAATSGAAAEVRVRASTAGRVTIQARSASALKSVTLAVAGPPSFVPKTQSLQPGELRNVAVVSAGKLRECWASTSVVGLTVVLDDKDITKAPAAAAGDRKEWVLTVIADPMIAEDGLGTITCRDLFLQEATLPISVDVP